MGDPRALRDPGRIALSAQRRRCGSRLPAPPPLDRRRPTPCTAGPPARTRGSHPLLAGPRAEPRLPRRPSVLTPGRRRVPSGSQIHAPRAWRGRPSNSLLPHELRHARLLCPSPFPRVCSDSFLLSQWCHPTISFFATPFSSCPQSFPASGSFPMSWVFSSESALYLKKYIYKRITFTTSVLWGSLA